jgi:exodeoxyribonuclease VII small subunit
VRGEGEEEAAVSGGAVGEPKLEERLRRIDQIVSALEADDLDLERALALFEEGVAHVRAAEALLADAELRVEELLGKGDRTRPLPGGEG